MRIRRSCGRLGTLLANVLARLGRDLCGCRVRGLCTWCGVVWFVCVLVYFSLKWNVVCINSQVETTIGQLCQQYDEGKVLGTLCPDICKFKTLVPIDCQAWHGGKEFVIKASYRDSPVFVKGRRLSAEENAEENLFWLDDRGNEYYPTLDEFKDILKSHIKHNFNISYESTMFFKLWPLSLHSDERSEVQNKMLLRLSLQTLWNLLQDPEYVFLSLFEHYDIFPELYGTCGGLYVVEEIAPLDLPSLLERTSFEAWTKRVKHALAILDLLEELDTMFDSPVHLCDIKSEHFGLSEYGRMKYNDLDNIYLKPVIDKSTGDGSMCEEHSDCNFFDCLGQCDKIKGKCTGGVVNNNLQVVCEKVFLGKSFGFKSLGGTGLLAARHGEKILQPLLEACANPAGSKGGMRVGADARIGKEIKKNLKSVVAIAERLKNENE